MLNFVLKCKILNFILLSKNRAEIKLVSKNFYACLDTTFSTKNVWGNC